MQTGSPSSNCGRIRSTHRDGVVPIFDCGASDFAAPSFQADHATEMRSDLGIPSAAIRLSTWLFTSACWRSSSRDASATPTRALNLDTAFSARLCRVAPLEVRHGYRHNG